ncbi:MAG: cellobiose phosphorylase [Candidatus Omnitrophica bacterium]|nr:cellobiose phosphorylase [Candidatus Omnitrophota bacterium]
MNIDKKEKKVKYRLEPNGEFALENYNLSKPFANFFPGIAGKYGIPMWVFYVNRGQAIASFGTKDKDHSILEFFPANKSWQLASLQGFRTFIKISRGKKKLFYEPFHNGFTNLGFKLSNKMLISPWGLKLEENNLSLGIKVKVEYFTIPNDSYAALVRIVTIENSSNKPQEIELADGLPQIVPFGTSNLFLKKLSRTIEAWMNVENLDKGVPFYKLDVDPTDRPEVIHIKEGNFYLSFHFDNEKPKIIKPVVDPQHIFGEVTDFSCPMNFLAAKTLAYPAQQVIKSKTPSAFSLLKLKLKPRGEKTFYSLTGYMTSREILNSSIAKITTFGYIARKKEENKLIIEGLQQDINTSSSSKEFDLYAKQTYLDNILRGGYPVLFNPENPDSTFYLYSRKHGDLERDYNKFQIQPTYFSQGNGNYRDMNQNRRCDIWFNPQIKEENLVSFLNLIQADGFNPLVIKGTSFIVKDKTALFSALKGMATEEQALKIAHYLDKPFTPGNMIFFLEENKIKPKISYDEFLAIVIAYCEKVQEAEHGEGFWTDHWTYNLDLLESYLGVYPENLKEIVFEKKVFTFYDNTETVKPRSEKYLLKDGHLKQLHAIHPDSAKKEMIKKRDTSPHIVRMDYGKGEIYQTTLVNKLLCLLANKLASLDPSGCGIEMEADKPNWFDALNGLPALFGSSICETFELKRLALFIKYSLEKTKTEKIYVTEEIHNFLVALDGLIKDPQYWDKSYSLKEDYRQKTRLGFSGKETEIKTSDLAVILNNALEKIGAGIAKARDKEKDIYYSYFINEATGPNKFIQKKVPFFLEGQMHALRLAEDTEHAKALYKATRSSLLYDKELKMYKVTAPLKSMPEEIGRCRVFTPGWLENESIWLHMEYKYLLETLKSGLYEEFYQDFKNVLIPFQNPQKYGRSILENSSFLVSSAFPDKNLHGNGFVARLSGSTAEFLSIWLTMNLGKEPFILNDRGELNLQFSPVLAGWLFDRKGIYSFNFLGNIVVTYHNPKRKDTFGKNGVKIKEIAFDDASGNPQNSSSGTIPAPYAQQIRSRQIKRIDIYLE